MKTIKMSLSIMLSVMILCTTIIAGTGSVYALEIEPDSVNFYNQTVISNEDPFDLSTDPRIDAGNKLSAKIREAEDAVPDGSNFTNESRQRVWEAINYAYELCNSETATVEELLAQIEVLQQAIDALEVPDINTDELWAVIEKAEYFIEREGRYTEISYLEFQEAGLRARVAYHYGQTQEEVDSAKAGLEAALENLQSKYQILFGDVNLDGEINIRDATMIQKGIAHIIDFDEIQEISADFNDDALVNVRDATAIQRALVGLAY